MPDREGYLLDDEVIVAGEVWTVAIADTLLGCEEEGCQQPGTVELSCYSDDPDGGGWKCLCEEHFEQWKVAAQAGAEGA